MIAAGALGALAIVGMGLTGGASEPRQALLAAASTSPAPPIAAAAASVRPASAYDPDLLVVTMPSRRDEEITTRQLTVTGFLRGASAPVHLSLEARSNRVIDSVVTYAHPTPDAAGS